MIQIARWPQIMEIPEQEKLSAFRRIFFESSLKQNFKDDEERESFFITWTGYYLDFQKSHIWLAYDDDKSIIGYLTGSLDSSKADEYYNRESLFRDLFKSFPADLHINLAAQARGHGIGSRLIDSFASEVQDAKLGGLHLVTSPEARNVSFYKKNGFDFTKVRRLKDTDYLFMGRRI